jgi:ribonuclease HII
VNNLPDLILEKHYRELGFRLIAGVDEAGRGALAGPVVAAAVILPENEAQIPVGIQDSKLLSYEKRQALFPLIQQSALAYGIGMASRAEIDTINILQASLLAMQRAIAELKPTPNLLLIDGREVIPRQPLRQECIIGGDRRSLSIAAASILAKVTRDELMLRLHARYPMFGFDAHKGYGTQKHRDAIKQHGPCHEHRTHFRGVRAE